MLYTSSVGSVKAEGSDPTLTPARCPTPKDAVLAETFDIGPTLGASIASIVALVTLIYQQRKTRTEAKAANEGAQQAAQEAREAAKELKPNGGSSIKDAIDRMEQRQIAHTQRSDARFNRIEKQMGLEPPMEVPSWPAPPPPPPPTV